MPHPSPRRPTTSILATVASAVVLCLALMVAPARAADATGGATGRATGGANGAPGWSGDPIGSVDAIDTSSRAAVRASYQGTLVPALATPTGWTGSAASCNAGSPSSASTSATLTAVNWFRAMAGLPAVAFDPTLSAKAQQGALMMLANGAITHDAPPDWLCYSSSGDQAVASSAVASGLTQAQAVALWMKDQDVSYVGHRRWILYPPQTALGAGAAGPNPASTYSALWILGPFGTRPVTTGSLAFSPYPTRGYFPAQLEPAGWWSLSNPDADFSHATVIVKRGAVVVPATVQAPFGGVGDNTLVWTLNPGFTLGSPDATYTVTVSGITGPGVPASYTYTTTLFDVDVDVPGAPTGVSASPGVEEATVSWGAPTDNGGSAITGYTVTSSPSGRTCTWTSGPHTCTVTGLPAGVQQRFRVTARNVNGVGPPSNLSSFVVPESASGSCATGVAPFPDVPAGQLFCRDIEWLTNLGVTGGFSDGMFKPTNAITRQSMARFLYRLRGSPAFTPPVQPSFTDIGTTHPFYKEIEWLASERIATGFAGGVFDATRPVSRQSMAAFLYRFLGSPTTATPTEASFTDVPTNAPFFKEIEFLVSIGVTTGFDDHTYRPATSVSRQAMAAFLHRLSELPTH